MRNESILLVQCGEGGFFSTMQVNKWKQGTSCKSTTKNSQQKKQSGSEHGLVAAQANIVGLSGWRHWVFLAHPVLATSSPTNAATAMGSESKVLASLAALLLRRGQSLTALTALMDTIDCEDVTC